MVACGPDHDPALTRDASQSVTTNATATGSPIDAEAGRTVVETDAPIATQDEITSPESPAATSQPVMAPPVEPPADILTDGSASSEIVAAAIDLDSGATRWAVPRSDAFTGVGLPIVDGERVMLPSGTCGGNVMTSVDARTGDTIWRSDADVPITDMGFRGSSEPIEIVGGIAMLRSSVGDQPMLVGIDPATGKQKWTASASQVVAESPLVVVVLVPESGAVRVLDRLTGSELWTAPATPDARFTAAVADGAAVYLQTGSQLMALEALNDRPLWTVDLAPAQMMSPLARAGDLLIGSSGADIVAFSAADGSERWRRPSTKQAAAQFWFELVSYPAPMSDLT
jgi:outer membrane protein assembly factor BamB